MTTVYWTEEKDPDDIDYFEAKVETDWLGEETISEVDFDVPEGSGLIVGGTGIDTNFVRCSLSGGNPGTHGILITVTTSGGRARQRTLYLVVREQ